MTSSRTARRILFYAAFACYVQLFGAAAGQEWGRWGYGVSGHLGSGISYNRETSGEETTWSMNRTNDYSLEVSGKILDPRLATFTIGGALSTSDVRSNQSDSSDSRLLSFVGNLSLLSGKPYPLDLRIAQSHQSGDSESDALSFGGSWRIVYGNLPSIFLNFDRVNVETQGAVKNETAFTTGNLRLTKRMFDSDVDAEFGVQNVTEEIRKSSTTRYFGRFTDTMDWSPATTMRLLADYFSEDNSRTIGSLFSLINRPDPTLSRSIGLGFRNSHSEEDSDTTLEGSGSIFKTFQPFTTMTVSPFSSAIISRRFASGTLGDASLVNWSVGSSLMSTYFRPVVATAAYGIGLTYSDLEEEGSDIGTTQQFNLGLQSRTLAPYNIRGDYTFTLERTLTERNRHQVSVRADGPVFPTLPALGFRTFAEFFNDNAKFAGAENRQTIFAVGASVSYTGIRRLYVDLGANALRSHNEDTSSWITRLSANASYTPVSRLSFHLTGQRETDSLVNTTRYEGIARVLYLFGRTTINLEYRFGARDGSGDLGYSHSISLRANRPFRFAF